MIISAVKFRPSAKDGVEIYAQGRIYSLIMKDGILTAVFKQTFGGVNGYFLSSSMSKRIGGNCFNELSFV